MLGQREPAVLEPFGVGHQADLYEHAFELDRALISAGAVLHAQAVDLAVGAGDLGRLAIGDDLDIGQRAELGLQHFVGAQLGIEFDQRDVADCLGQVDRRFDARIAAADDRNALALEQRPVAMRAIGHALVAVFGFAGDAHVAPAGPGGEDQAAGLEAGSIAQFDRVQAALFASRNQFDRLRQIHQVDIVVADMPLEFAGQLGPFGIGRAGQVLDPQRVMQLPAEAFGCDAGAKALARSVDRGRRTGRAAAHHQHFERVLRGKLLGRLGFAAGIDLGENLGQFHLAVIEGLAVEEGCGHRHDVAAVDLVLEGAAFDQRGGDARIFERHQRQRLHHVGAVVARQREIHLEIKIVLEPADLF